MPRMPLIFCNKFSGLLFTMAASSSSSSSSVHNSDDIVLLEVRSPDSPSHSQDNITPLPTWELHDSLDLNLSQGIIKIRVHRSRLMEHSTYFRSLFGGSFKESLLDNVIIQWELATFVAIMRLIYGVPVNISFINFLPLLEGALFFGVEDVIIKCEKWSLHILSKKMKFSEDTLQQLINIWNFGADNGICFILEIYTLCFAVNFGGILRDASFATLSYVLLNTCINHPLLTVDSERQLCEALLDWLAINNQCSKLISCNTPNNYFQILEKVRIGLLPLEFILGRLWRDYPKMVASLQKMTIFDQISSNDHSNIQDGELDMFRLRLTQYNEKLDLSKCQQVTGKMLFFFLLPPATMDATLCSVASSETLKNLVEKLMTARSTSEGVQYQALEESHLAASFSNLKEVNISCCWRLHEEDIIEWLRLLSPCLRIFISQYCSQLKISILYKLSQVCPLIEEVDLTVDISPAISHKVSILHVSCEAYPGSQTSSNWMLPKGSTLSNLTRLSLKGRTDIQDNDLRIITVLSHSINFLDLGGCISLTDLGISCFLTSCTQLRSLHVAWTSFGQHSIKSLLSSTNHKESLLVENDFALSLNSCCPLIELDIGGCRDIDEIFLIKYIESAYSLSCLSMRHTNLGDEVLYAFKGTSLKELDVCETLVSGKALSHIIVRNPGLKILKARGCKRMANCFYHVQVHDPSSFHQNSELIQAMGRLLNLQELAVGWGLSGFSVAMMKPVLASLKCLTVGLGGSLGTQIWLMLPEICPLLEYISVCFQTVSDEGVLHVLKNLRYMHTLELQHCFGELSSKILSVSVSNLKSLRLDRVAPWMTDENLDMLTQNMRSLSQLSLAGCTLLTPDAQHIIASGWPGLTNIRLEDCFKVTANGVSSLLDCKSVEDLVLRHNGSGIRRNFVMEAALKFPLLRTLSLDLCDACESGFDTPLYLDRFSLCVVKLSRCKLQKCALEIKDFRMGPKSLQPHRVHKETIILEWTSTDLKTTVVAERI